MRRALIGLILAATAMVPVAAQAQDDDRTSARERYQRLEQRNQQRYEQRQERREARQQQQQQQQAQPQPEPRAERRQERTEQRQDRQERTVQRQDRQERTVQRQERFERRGDRQRDLPSTVGWQGPRTPETREDANRYDRRARENAIRYGTEQQRREVREEWRRDGGDRDRRDWRGDRDRRDWRGDRDRRGGWDRGWRNDRRYDWNSWRYRNRSIFRLSPYYSPYRNHRYSRFSIGIFLNQGFYDRRYWIGDPWQYRLPAAPYGTQWVRYYNDVLLVDVYTGEVVDVIYDFFW